jgi:WD40 repeat protein
MKEHNDAFTPEQVDEQIEQEPQSRDTQNAEFIIALKHDYQQEKTLDALTMHRAWERITEIEGRRYLDYAGEKLKPGRPRRHKTAWPPLGIVAAIVIVLLFAATGGIVYVAQVKNVVHVIYSKNVATPVIKQTEQTPVKGQQADITIYTHTQSNWGINSLDWSPDNTRILSVNQTLQSWDATTGAHLITFNHADGDTYQFLLAKWSPDGTRIAAASDDVEIWNATTGKSLLTFHPSPIAASQTAPGQTALVSTSSTIYRPSSYTTGQNKMQLLSSLVPEDQTISHSGGDNNIFALAWSPDSKYIATTQAFMGSGNAAVTIWDATTGKLVMTFPGPPTPAIAWSPDGKYIASVNGSTIQVWKPLTGQIVYTYHTLSSSFVGLAWSPDSTHIAGYDSDGTTYIWVALANQHQVILQGKGAEHAPRYVSSPLAWSPDSKEIATVGDNVQIWNAATGDPIFTYSVQTQGVCNGTVPSTSNGASYPCVNTVAWSPNGKYIASGDGPGGGTLPSKVEVWKVSAGI